MRRIVFLFLLSTVTASAVLLPNQPNRDKSSTRKFDVGVFTQPGPETDIVALIDITCFRPYAQLESAVGRQDAKAAFLSIQFGGAREVEISSNYRTHTHRRGVAISSSTTIRACAANRAASRSMY